MILKLSNRRQGWYYFEVERVSTRVVSIEEYSGQDGRDLPVYNACFVDFPRPCPAFKGNLDPEYRIVEISYKSRGLETGGTIATTHAAFLMNDAGDTIETLNHDPGDSIIQYEDEDDEGWDGLKAILPKLTDEDKKGPWGAEVTDPQ